MNGPFNFKNYTACIRSGLFYNFTHVKMKGPNKYILKLKLKFMTISIQYAFQSYHDWRYWKSEKDQTDKIMVNPFNWVFRDKIAQKMACLCAANPSY